MLSQLLLAILLGIFAGTITGLSPGIHINLVAALLMGASGLLLKYADPLSLAAFIVAMSITHTFLDTLPSIYLGAPDEATAMAALPGHKLLLKGEGITAVRLMVLGSLCSVFAGMLLFPIIIAIIIYGYASLKAATPYLLIIAMLYMVFKDQQWKASLLVAALAGILGILVFALHTKDPLLPLFSGLFGASLLISSLMETNRIPAQRPSPRFAVPAKKAAKSIVLGSFAAMLTSFLPGLGPSQGAIIASQLDRKADTEGFLILIGAIGTANMLFSLATLYAMGIARNGSMIAAGQLVTVDLKTMLLLSAVALCAAGIAAFLALRLAGVFGKVIPLLPYRALCLCVIGIIVAVVCGFSGRVGFAILVAATLVGLLPSRLGAGKNHLMACLLVPIIVQTLA